MSLSETLKSTIQKEYSQGLKNMQLSPRYGQRLMIAEIAKTLGTIERDEKNQRSNNAGIIAVEAGTGTGKTLAYIIAALPIAIAAEKKLIISTATIALQEQILNKDLPQIQKALFTPFDFQLAKGRGRYLCLLKLDQHLQALSGIFPNMELFKSEKKQEQQPQELYEKMLSAYASGKWQGDKDYWPEEINPEQWQGLTSNHRECSNRRCSHFSQCAFFKARENLLQADVIVVNHDLMLADLALGGGIVLPPLAESIYIIDEAHHLAEKAQNHLQHELALLSSSQFFKQLKTNLSQFFQIGVAQSIAKEVANLNQHIEATQEQLNLLITALKTNLDTQEHLRFKHGELPQNIKELLTNLNIPLTFMVTLLTKLHDLLQEALDDKGVAFYSQDVAENWHAQIGTMMARCEQLLNAQLALTLKDNPKHSPMARWVQQKTHNEQQEISLHAAPTSVAEELNQRLWQEVDAAVLTSATLTALSKFEHLIWQTGLPEYSQFARVPSPFNYPENAELEIVNLASEPNSDEFQTDVENWLIKNIQNKQATLVLFSSKRQLEDTRNFMQEHFTGNLLCQGFQPKLSIIEEHKQHIDKQQQSVIFGLSSFAEGIDLPGKYLEHLIIIKLPFAVPNDPIQEATSEWLASQNKNPFMHISLPHASIRLIQACGRLIRSEQDTGRISILDKRLHSKFYGKQLLNALPPFKRI